MSSATRKDGHYTACWYTPVPLAYPILKRAVERGMLWDGATVADFHVGGGAWFKALRLIEQDTGWSFTWVASDCDPKAEGLRYVEQHGGYAYAWSSKELIDKIKAQGGRIDLVMGNPPFSAVIEPLMPDGETRTEFVAHTHVTDALSVSKRVLFIVPVGLSRAISRGSWARKTKPTHCWPLCPRARFERLMPNGVAKLMGSDNAQFDARVWTPMGPIDGRGEYEELWHR